MITLDELKNNYCIQVDYAVQTVLRDYESPNQATREQSMKDGDAMKNGTISSDRLYSLAKRHRAWLFIQEGL